MSTIGSGTRSSTSPQVAPSTAAAAKRPKVGADVQPQLSPSVSATSNEISAPERRIAPGMSTREGVFTGDSGTKKCTSTIAAATPIAPMMKSHRHEA